MADGLVACPQSKEPLWRSARVCGEAAFIDVGEVHRPFREFTLIGCCEANINGWIEEMRSWDRSQWCEWFYRKTGVTLRQVVLLDPWQLDFGLSFRPITFRAAAEFVARFHRHSPPPQGWKFGTSVWNDQTLIGVVTVGRPVSAALQRQGAIEITRVCVRDDFPGLNWNAASMLYGWACRHACREGYSRIVTYTIDGELGTSLIAAGFQRVHRTRSGTWNRRGRPRTDKSSTQPKWRWERILRPGSQESLRPIREIQTRFLFELA